MPLARVRQILLLAGSSRSHKARTSVARVGTARTPFNYRSFNGKRIPVDLGVHRGIECQSRAVAHGVGLKLPDAGAHHPRAHEYPAMTSDDVDVNAGAGQESCGAFNQRAGRRDIDDSQFRPVRSRMRLSVSPGCGTRRTARRRSVALGGTHPLSGSRYVAKHTRSRGNAENTDDPRARSSPGGAAGADWPRRADCARTIL